MESTASRLLNDMALATMLTHSIPTPLRWGSVLIVANTAAALLLSPPSLVWLMVLYGTLLVHTAVAIPFFAPLVSTKSGILKMITIASAVMYVLLAWSLDDPTQFFALLAILFFLAAIGYRVLFSITGIKKFQQKILIDGLGGLFALVTLALLLIEKIDFVLPITTIGYVLVTLWMLWIRPFYHSY